MRGLVLSLFPGIGMLDRGFEEEGFCVVRGPDLLWGGDVREFFPPPDRFDGVIGGDPCQSHSSLANLVRAKGLEPSFPDLTPEFRRVVEVAQPTWFLRENVPQAPQLVPDGYSVASFILDNCWLGEAQMRKRRFWFGWRLEAPAPNLRKWIPGVALELPDATPTVAGDARAVPDRYGGSGKVKVTADGGHDGTADSIGGYRRARKAYAKVAPVTGRNEGRVGSAEMDYSPPRRSLAEMLELQGLPKDWLEHQPWLMQAKRKMIGNGVPIPMARAVAKAVAKALADEPKP